MKVLLTIFLSITAAVCFGQLSNDTWQTAEDHGALSVPPPCGAGGTGGIGAVTQISGTNVSAQSETPGIRPANCVSGSAPSTVLDDVWFTFMNTGNSVTIDFVSTLNEPVISLYYLSGGSLTILGCYSSTSSTFSHEITNASVGQQLYLQVAGLSSGDEGTFDIDVKATNGCGTCVVEDLLTVVAPPVNGRYETNQTVDFCYYITKYSQESTNWMHGVAPVFGPGWDLNSLAPTVVPTTCMNGSNGLWGWFTNVQIINTGGQADGFFFDLDNDGDPNNNFGDNCDSTDANWEFCWQITTNPTLAAGTDLSIQIQNFSDGESGSWTDLACTNDPDFMFYAQLGTCAVPTTTVTMPSCEANCDGSIGVTADGTAPFSYTLKLNGNVVSSVTGQSGAYTFTGLCEGDYTIEAGENTGCGNTAAVSLSSPVQINTGVTGTAATCATADGTASSVPTGGTTPFTYSWSNGSTTSTIAGLGLGTYVVSVSEAGGCMEIDSFVVVEPNISVTADSAWLTCYGDLTGVLTSNVLSGTTPFTYVWSNGATTPQVSGLGEGTYSVSVQDASGCTGVWSDSHVYSPAALSVSEAVVDAACGENGSIELTVTGGNPAFSYAWTSAISDTAFAYNVPAGNYDVSIADGNGCVEVHNYTVAQLGGDFTFSEAVIPPTCFGMNDGMIQIMPSGTASDYTYTWYSVWSAQTLPSPTDIMTNLEEGDYAMSITNGQCQKTNTYQILAPQMNILGESTTPATCTACDGQAAVLINAGATANLPYTYLWSDGSTTASISGLCAGTVVTLDLMDNNGCVESLPMTVGVTSLFTAGAYSTDSIVCNGGATADLIIGTTGATGTVSYLWSNGATTSSITGLAAGTYSFTATDQAGCVASSSQDIYEPAPIAAPLQAFDVSCAGAQDGAVFPNVSGGVWDCCFTYVWSNGSTTDSLSNIGPGNYTMSVTDPAGCVAVVTASVSEPIPLMGTSSSTDAGCSSCDGTIDLAYSGGTLPYAYIWSNGGASASLSALCAGTYNVDIYDANACHTQESITILNSSGLAANITATTIACSGELADIGVNVTGGTPGFSYSWNTGEITPAISSTVAGFYSVTINDASGCVHTETYDLTEPVPLELITTVVQPACDADGSIVVAGSGGTPTYSYGLDLAALSTVDTYDNLIPDVYTIYIADANGCVDSATAWLNAADPLVLTANSSNPTACQAMDGTIAIGVQGAVAPYTYAWTEEPTYLYNSGANAYYLVAGDYSVAVTSADGCTADTTITIDGGCAPNVIEGYVYDDQNGNCTYDVGVDIPLEGHLVELDGQWVYTNSAGYYMMYVDAGTYTLTAQDNDPYRSLECPAMGGYTFTLGSTPSVNEYNFGYTADEVCSWVRVEVMGWGMTPCVNNWFWVDYWNNGTTPSLNTEVVVTLEDNQTIVYTNGNLIAQNGNDYTFSVGDLQVGDYDYFYIEVYLDCDMDLMGSTSCVEAVSNAQGCDDGDGSWDRSSVQVEGQCTDDSLACFTVTNTGDAGDGDMDGTTEYRIYVNNNLVEVGTVQLNGGESIEICRVANGETVRMEVDQRPGHPGFSQPRDHIEMCGDPGYDLGYVLNFPEDDMDEYVSIDCHEVTASYDPNEKKVKPQGLTEEFHYTHEDSRMEYMLHFQNTGTDTAFNVVLRDTLSVFLDEKTIVKGASSAPCEMYLLDNNILEFRFNNINLPDSGASEPNSHGFASFSIDLVEDVAIGTVVENRVGIIFDFNEAIITNTVFNTIGIPSTFDISSVKVYDEQMKVNVYPNPFNESATIEVTGLTEGDVILTDMLGRPVYQTQLANGKATIQREGISSGIYFYSILTDGKVKATGRVVVD